MKFAERACKMYRVGRKSHTFIRYVADYFFGKEICRAEVFLWSNLVAKFGLE